MSGPLERYLRRATRGLHGTVKKDVWNELEQDVQERVRVARAFGLSEPDALKRALEQLGDPREVSTGMVRTYVWPRARKVSLALGLVGALGVSALAASAVKTFSGGVRGYFFVSEPQLTAALGAGGVQLERSANRLNLRLPDGQRFIWVQTPSNTFVRGEERVTVLNNLLDAALRAKLPVTVRGWETLQIGIGSASFTLEPPSGQDDFKAWYADIACVWAKFPTPVPTTPENTVTLEGKRPDLAGRVVVAVSNVFDRRTKMLGDASYVDVVRVAEDGSFRLKALPQRIASLNQTGQQVYREGLYLAVFPDTYSSGVDQKFTPLKIQLKPNQTLEPGKTYTL